MGERNKIESLLWFAVSRWTSGEGDKTKTTCKGGFCFASFLFLFYSGKVSKGCDLLLPFDF